MLERLLLLYGRNRIELLFELIVSIVSAKQKKKYNIFRLSYEFRLRKQKECRKFTKLCVFNCRYHRHHHHHREDHHQDMSLVIWNKAMWLLLLMMMILEDKLQTHKQTSK